jgi:hypothetical protein
MSSPKVVRNRTVPSRLTDGHQRGGNVGEIACRTLAAWHGYWGYGKVGVVWEWGRIQYQHADAKVQMRGWMNAVCGMAARLCSVSRQRKTRYQGGKKCGSRNAEICAHIGGDLTIERLQGGCAPGCTSLLCTFAIVRRLCPAARVSRSTS